MNDLKRPFIWEDVTHLWYRADRKLHTNQNCRYCSDKHRKVRVETLNPNAKELCTRCVENYTFEPVNGKRYTKPELLEWIDRFVLIFGVVPRYADFRNPIGPRPQVYEKRFGTFSKAIEMAGYD